MISTQEDYVSQTPWQFNDLMQMSDSEYDLWITLLEQRTGIVLPEERKSFLLSKLSIRMRELGIEDYKSYFDYVTNGKNGRIEWVTLVDRLTIHETRFFRDTQALAFIREVFLEKQELINSSPNIHIWSVGCATGEEPYSLMMYIDKYMTDSNSRGYLAVTASDISQDALATGKKAIYHKNRFSNVPCEFFDNYIDEIEKDHFQIKESLRKRICFNRLNLLELETSSVGAMEIILCQNVLIYFQKQRRIEILNQLVEHLAPNGLLILGAGEIVGWKHPEIQAIKYDGVLAYQRKIPSELKPDQQQRVQA